MSDEKRSEDEAPKADPAEAKAEDEATTKVEEPAAAPAAAEEPAEEEEEEESDEDAHNPAAIARRVAALGAGDRDEELAREEERKLAERRAAGKKKGGKKKAGLEAAASKKLGKIGTRAEPRRPVAMAADADPLIAQTTKISDWAKKNQKTVQAVGLVVVAGLLGAAGFLYYSHKHEAEASAGLARAVETQSAKIGEPPKSEDDAPQDTYFKTYADRQKAALDQYKDVSSKFPKTGAAILARLAEGSLLLDKRDAAGALAAFDEVKGSALAAADIEVKGRALEGIGFAHELKATATPAEKDKELDAALAAFRELENAADVKGFKELAMYNQARVLMNKGDRDKAKEILLSLKARIEKSEEPIGPGIPPPPSFPYLHEMAMDRLREIDPEAAPKEPKGPPGGMPGGGAGKMTQEQIQKLLEQMKKQGGGKPPGGH